MEHVTDKYGVGWSGGVIQKSDVRLRELRNQWLVRALCPVTYKDKAVFRVQ